MISVWQYIDILSTLFIWLLIVRCFETSVALVHSGVELTVVKVRVELMCNPTHLLMPAM